ncbi:MAG: gamma-glutamylcyclotransferase family protein [Thermacetogeniaceae bacterium]|jgi:hypothetical protein
MNDRYNDALRFHKVPADAPDFSEFKRVLGELKSILSDSGKADIGLLHELGNFQDEDGSFKLTDSWKIPSDARVDFCYMPTYMGAAIFMREYLRPDKNVPEQMAYEILLKALKASLGRGLAGHGYESEKGLLIALDLFRQGGLKGFLETARPVCPEFHALIWDILDSRDADLKEKGAIKGAWGEDYTDSWRKTIENIKPTRRLYLAYGSNMAQNQMLSRCPQAKLVGMTHLNGWALKFHHFADIEKHEGANAPSVIWDITKSDEKELDHYEGYAKHYVKKNIIVTVNDAPVSAMAYVMTDWKKTGAPGACEMPSESYLDLIQKGYSEAGFIEKITF